MGARKTIHRTRCARVGLAALLCLALVVVSQTANASSLRASAHQHAIRPLLPGGHLGPEPFTRWPRLRSHLATDAHASIIGGTSASQGQFPYLAFIAYSYPDGSGFSCSGTVVSPTVVLTAGHCGVDETTGAPLGPSGFAVVTHSVDWTNSSQRQVSGVSRVVVNPSYNATTHDNDSTLLFLTTPTTAPAIALAGPSDVNLEQGGTGAVIAGWGITTASAQDIPSLLQWADTIVQRPVYCSQFAPTSDSAQLCTVNYPSNNTGTCSGDSGGPLLAAHPGGGPIEIGITSYGPSDCDTVSADYFTRVEPLVSWIDSVAGITPPPPPPNPSLPTMHESDAHSYVSQVLGGVFGNRFKHRHHYSVRCAQQTNTQFQCGVSWRGGPNDYSGNVTVFYVFGSGNSVNWSDHYSIQWVSDSCARNSAHPGRCPRHTKSGTF